MRLFNESSNALITSDLREARTFTERTRGLLGTQTPVPLFFRTRLGVHTFGMRYAIDVVVCDKNFQIRMIKKSLKPNRFFFWNPLYPYVFELPTGDITRSGTKLGDYLSIGR